MKKLFLTLPLIALLLLPTTGCITTPTGEQAPDPAVLEMIAQSASALTATAAVQYNPSYRLELELTRTSLEALVAAGSNDPAALQAALSSLPIKQFHGDQGAVVTTGEVTIWDNAGKQLARLDSKHLGPNWVLPIARGMLSGLNQALGPGHDTTP